MDRSVSYSELRIEIKLRLRFAAAAPSDSSRIRRVEVFARSPFTIWPHYRLL